MTKVMMMLGAYPFMLETAAYQELRRVSSYRWPEQARLGQKPASQFVGPGADQITLQGEILPHWKGGLYQLDLMRAQAARGKPMILLEGHLGTLLGDWVILTIEEQKRELFSNGAPRLIQFSMTLREYGDDRLSLDDLALGIAALSTVARLI